MQKTILILLAITIFIVGLYYDPRSEDPFMLSKGLLLRFMVGMTIVVYLFKINMILSTLVLYIGLNCAVMTWLAHWSLVKFENVLMIYGAYCLIVKNIKKEYVPWIIGVICLTGLIQAIYGVFQAFGIDPFFPINYNQPFKDNIAGFLGNPNRLGGYLAITSTLTLAMINRKRLWLIDTWLVQIIVIGLTQCSNAIISCFVGTVFAITFKIKGKFMRSLFLILTIGTLMLAMSKVDKLNIKKDPMRLPVWARTMEMAKEKPLFGWGLGSYQFIFPYNMPKEVHGYTGDSGQVFYRAHNDPIQMKFELGKIGLLLIICLYAVMIEKFVRSVKTPEIIGLAGVILVFTIFSFASFPVHLPPLAFILIIAVACLDVSYKHYVRISYNWPDKLCNKILHFLKLKDYKLWLSQKLKLIQN